MTEREQLRQQLEKFVPKRVIDIMDKSMTEAEMAVGYLEKIKPYKVIYQPEIKGKGAVYTMADMIKMFRYGLHHNDEAKPKTEKRKPLFKGGDVLREKVNPDHIITLKGYKGEHYKVREQGKRELVYYSMDYVETNFERYDESM